MTEDDIEERSFRSLLPSESHRRVTMEQKRGSHEESEEANRKKCRELDTSKVAVPLRRPGPPCGLRGLKPPGALCSSQLCVARTSALSTVFKHSAG